MARSTWNVYLSGEIHSDWRERIETGAREAGLPVEFSAPVTDHAASDAPGQERWARRARRSGATTWAPALTRSARKR